MGAVVTILGIWGFAVFATPMGWAMPGLGAWSAMMSGNGMGMHAGAGTRPMMGGNGYGMGMGAMMQGSHGHNMTATLMQQHQEYCAQMMQQSNDTGMMGPNTVAVANYQFLPATLTVKKGTTVTWVNMDQVAHTVSAGTHEQETGLFESGLLNHMDRFSFTLTEAGTYLYHCDPHQYMTSTIVVEA